ncbi:MAG: acyltransferase [Pseudomonadota bacterium]
MDVNRFDLIRLSLAGIVLVYHAFALSAVDPFAPIEHNLALMSELAIQGFFIVSGALVYGSYERSRDVMDYAGKRIRRLYPAYLVVILVPTLIAVLGAITLPEAWGQVFRYLAANLVFLNFLEPSLPGLFEANRTGAVNGALWTLKIEVMFYLAVPVLAAVLSRLGRYWGLGIALMIIGALAWREAMLTLDFAYSEQLARQLPGQMMYFAIGMALWRLWDVARTHAVTLFGIGVVCLTLSILVPTLETLRVLGLAGVIAGVAFGPGPKLNAAAWGDISYGVYITHFPIVQALVAAGVYAALGFIGGLAVTVVLVFGSSYLLWWLVEKPALRRDSHYRKVSDKVSEAGVSIDPRNRADGQPHTS